MFIYVLDSTKDSLIYKSVLRSRPGDIIDITDNIDIAMNNIIKNPYDLLVLSSGHGKSSIYDLAERIKHAHVIGKSEIIFVENNPPVRERFRSLLRGRKLYKYGQHQLSDMEDLLEQME